MRSVMRLCLICTFFAFAVGAFGQATTTSQAMGRTQVVIAGSEQRSMKSVSTGREYDIYVHIPADYEHNSKKYPVVYILDGQWDFKLVDSVLGGLIYDKFSPEMILVGISYSGEHPDYDALRAMDLTPTVVGKVKGSGDAPKFLNFIKTELIPYIESNYRADSSRRMLQGCSYAGLFTLYTMFTEPQLFTGYISASPAVPYDNDFIFKREADYARTHKELPAKLYLSVGGSESLRGPVEKFMETLKGRGYKGLKLETRIAEGERHASNKPEVYNRGLRFLVSQ